MIRTGARATSKSTKFNIKNDEDASLDWITQYSVCGNEAKQTATVSGLNPATRYLFRVSAVGQIVGQPNTVILCLKLPNQRVRLASHPL